MTLNKHELEHLLVEAFKAYKEDPKNRLLVFALANAARIHAGFPIPGTTLKHVNEREFGVLHSGT